MSLDLLKVIFSALPDCKEWHAHLLSFTHSKRYGTIYNCRRIELEPSERLDVLIQDISLSYIGKGRVSWTSMWMSVNTMVPAIPQQFIE